MEKMYSVSQFAQALGVSVKTLQRWDREGILKAYRTPTNRRYYTQTHYEDYRQKSQRASDTQASQADL